MHTPVGLGKVPLYINQGSLEERSQQNKYVLKGDLLG